MTGKGETMKVVFLGSNKGKSKKGNDFCVVSLAQIMDDKLETVYVRDFFCDASCDFSSFRFGDEVSAKFVASDYLGGRPRLEGLTLVKASPYKKE